MRLAILILILIAADSLVRWYLQAPRDQAELSSTETEMVQDPNCETYIPVTEAVTATIAGREHHFCSEQCAEEYRNKHNVV